MFTADLLIVSIWALFGWHFGGSRIIMTCLILMRLALCFEMYHKSRWAFSSAVLFAIALGFFDVPGVRPVYEPISHLVYVMGCLSGYVEGSFVAFSPYRTREMDIIIWMIWGAIAVWLVLVPFVCTLPNKSIIPIYRHKKKIWWYIGGVLSFCGLVYLDNKDFALFFGCSLLSATHVVYQMIYSKEPVLQKLVQDRLVLLYASIIVIFFIAMITGLHSIFYLKGIVALLAPVSLYVIALKLTHSTTIKTLPAFLFAISGLLFINIYDRAHELVITFISIGSALCLFASWLTYRQCKSISAAIMLMIANAYILPMFLLGYNPYTLIKADNVHLFGQHRGLYEYSYNGNVGLRDRYGVIIPAENQKMYFLDHRQNYVAVLVEDKSRKDGEYGVYCLSERRFVIDPCAGIAKIEKTNGNEYKMIDSNGRHFASFSLPINVYGIFNKNVEFKPHFSDVNTSVGSFLGRLKDGYEIDLGDNPYWQEMKEHNPRAYDLLCKLMSMAGMESSPANDLAYVKAVATMIENDNYYKGNFKKALKEIAELLEILGGGNRSELNKCAYLSTLMESINLFAAYDGLISHGEAFNCEYQAWHDLMEAIVCYHEWCYNNNSELQYMYAYMDMELEKVSWLKRRKEFVDIENMIINNKCSYVCKLDSVMSIDDAKDIIDYYHCKHSPAFYHPLYYEIQPAFEDWISARNCVAVTLPTEQAASYTEVTKELESEYAGIIKSLDHWGLRPALNWDGRNSRSY